MGHRLYECPSKKVKIHRMEEEFEEKGRASVFDEDGKSTDYMSVLPKLTLFQVLYFLTCLIIECLLMNMLTYKCKFFELLEKGFIKDSLSSYGVPALLTLTKDRTWRMYVDTKSI